MHIVTTCPVSDRHLTKIRDRYPEIELNVCASIQDAEPFLPYAEILVTYGEDLTTDIIAKCVKLKWIQVISAGLERLPFEAIKKQGILVTNARGIHRGPMAEHTLGIILMFARRMLEYYRLQQSKEWNRDVRLEEVDGKTLGIIGAGSIGSEIAKRAKVFNMNTIGMATQVRTQPYFDEIVDREGLDKLLQVSDYIVVAVPLTSATTGLIGERELRLMKSNAVLINIARGKVVDEEALIYALRHHWIRGAALDVFANEPLPPDSPLWTLNNCLITPHISARSPKYMERAQEIFRHNLDVFMTGTGQMVNVIDLSKGY